MKAGEAPKFIVDINVGKLARWLRMMGYDTLLFGHGDDFRLVRIALDEARIVVTRDTHIMERRVVTTGRLKAVLVTGDQPEEQMRQMMKRLDLDSSLRPFTLCLECNQPLVEISKQRVAERVPPHVFRTQSQFVECPACQRVYWRGTHWQAMTRRLHEFARSPSTDSTVPGKRQQEEG